MVCRTCLNTLIAARKGHSECMYHCARFCGWHKDTPLGAIEAGNRHMYDEICQGRHVAPQILKEGLAAASLAWEDVVDTAVSALEKGDILQIVMRTIVSGHTRLAEKLLRRHFYGDDDARSRGFEQAVLSGKVDVCVWAEYFWKFTEEDFTFNRKVLIVDAIRSKSYQMLEYVVDRVGLPRNPNVVLRHVVGNCEDYYMFRFIWDNIGDKSVVEPSLKNWCIEKNRMEVLRCIHKSVPTWPETFLQTARRGRQTELRRYLIKYAEEHGALEVHVCKKRALHEMMEIIDDVGMAEGQYIKVCRLMRDLHTENFPRT